MKAILEGGTIVEGTPEDLPSSNLGEFPSALGNTPTLEFEREGSTDVASFHRPRFAVGCGLCVADRLGPAREEMDRPVRARRTHILPCITALGGGVPPSGDSVRRYINYTDDRDPVYIHDIGRRRELLLLFARIIFLASFSAPVICFADTVHASDGLNPCVPEC